MYGIFCLRLDHLSFSCQNTAHSLRNTGEKNGLDIYNFEKQQWAKAANASTYI